MKKEKRKASLQATEGSIWFEASTKSMEFKAEQHPKRNWIYKMSTRTSGLQENFKAVNNNSRSLC